MEAKKPYMPTGSLETYLPLYRELYKKYKQEFRERKEQSEGGKKLAEEKAISTDSHFEYFLIEEGWKGMRKMLDRPLIESSKYKVGETIKFIKEDFVAKGASLEEREKSRELRVTCTATILNVKTSDLGTGEVLYELGETVPACWESNPYALEKNVLSLIPF